MSVGTVGDTKIIKDIIFILLHGPLESAVSHGPYVGNSCTSCSDMDNYNSTINGLPLQMLQIPKAPIQKLFIVESYYIVLDVNVEVNQGKPVRTHKKMLFKKLIKCFRSLILMMRKVIKKLPNSFATYFVFCFWKYFVTEKISQ